VGIISPASPVEKREVEPALHIIEAYGLSVSFGEHAFLNRGFLSGTDAERLEDFYKFWADPEIKAIFCTRGGYGTLRLLSSLNFDFISRFPKILVGYSDITALLLSIYAKAGLMTFHGPMLKGGDRGKSLEGLLRYLFKPACTDIRISDAKIIRPGVFEGRLVGGNLTMISHMIGTGFLPDLGGSILLLEDVNEAPYRIDRALTQLKLSGYLEGLAGILLGSFTGCGPRNVITKIFADLSGELKLPCVAGLPVGHGAKNIPIAIGSLCQVDTDRHLIRIYPWRA